jgi:G3E family GTPase
MARLSSIVLAIDSGTLLSSIVNGNLAAGVASPCILADQIECADVIVLNGEPADRESRLARAVVSALNPSGCVIPRSREAPTPKLFNAERSFDFEATFAGAGWRKLMEGEPGVRHSDEGVTMFVYRARQPFRPEKFWNLIQMPFPGVFRAKGFFWLATRMGLVGGLNIAGSECHYSPAGQWWAAHERDHDSEVPERLKKEWAEPFGDRRQAIAFIGIGMDSRELSARLDACLLSESEMKSDERSWAMLPDPFPAWSAKGHDHDCDEHDCCHH